MISVCMATYNGENYIACQLDSILSQLGSCDEIVISDDGSNDNTMKIILSYNDSRIKIFKGPCKGYIQNFSNAISKAKGDFIFLSDQDDIWLPGKVSKVMDKLVDFKIVLHNALLVDGNGHSKNQNLFPNSIRFDYFRNLIFHQTYGCCLAFNSSLKDLILPIPENKGLLHETWITLLCQIVFGSKSMYYIPENLICYRRHENNASLRDGNRPLLVKLLERFSLLSYSTMRSISFYFK